MDKSFGRKVWAIPEGFIPKFSHAANEDMESHEAVCILNTGRKDAHLALTVYFKDKDPVGPYRLLVPGQRTRHIRLNDLTDPEPIPKGVPFSTLIESDVDIVVQHTRIDTRQSENALMTTMGFSLNE